jgi:hypothetical protein
MVPWATCTLFALATPTWRSWVMSGPLHAAVHKAPDILWSRDCTILSMLVLARSKLTNTQHYLSNLAFLYHSQTFYFTIVREYWEIQLSINEYRIISHCLYFSNKSMTLHHFFHSNIAYNYKNFIYRVGFDDKKLISDKCVCIIFNSFIRALK